MSRAAQYSGRVYLRLARADVAFFRFCLEAQDNLALFSCLGQEPPEAGGRMVLTMLFAPRARAEVLRWLDELARELPLELLAAPHSMATRTEGGRA